MDRFFPTVVSRAWGADSRSLQYHQGSQICSRNGFRTSSRLKPGKTSHLPRSLTHPADPLRCDEPMPPPGPSLMDVAQQILTYVMHSYPIQALPGGLFYCQEGLTMTEHHKVMTVREVVEYLRVSTGGFSGQNDMRTAANKAVSVKARGPKIEGVPKLGGLAERRMEDHHNLVS